MRGTFRRMGKTFLSRSWWLLCNQWASPTAMAQAPLGLIRRLISGLCEFRSGLAPAEGKLHFGSSGREKADVCVPH